MKKIAILLGFIVLIVLVGWVTMSMTASGVPALPNDVQMVEPDSSLPKELTNFWGKWTGGAFALARVTERLDFFVIVEKIDREKAVLYIWSSRVGKWVRTNAEVVEDGGKYRIRYVPFPGRVNELSLRKDGSMELSFSGVTAGGSTVTLKRVP